MSKIEVIIDSSTEDDDDIFIPNEDETQAYDNLMESFVEHRLFEKLEEKGYDDSDFVANCEIIKMKKIDLEILFNLFDPTFDVFVTTIINVFKGPYLGDFILRTVISWYTKNPNNNADTIREYFDTHYKPQNNNGWFFAIVNNLPTNIRNIILEKYINNTYDDTAKIDISDELTLTRMKKKDYKKRNGKGIRVGDFLTDLKKVVALVEAADTLIIIKVSSTKSQKTTLSFINYNTFKSKLMRMKLGYFQDGKKLKEIIAWDVFNAGNNQNCILLEELCFHSKDPNVFSYFQGYRYDMVEEIDLQLIKPYIDHVHDIICSKNDEYYNYVINWISFIFQNPSGKTETVILLTGPYGTGKNTFTNPICELLGDYANDNTKLENLTGTFNASILYKKLLVCNEAKAFSSNKKFDNEVMKTLITESTIDITKKFQETLHQENIANFILLSNNYAPIPIEQGDRRYFVLEVSSDKMKDFNYFHQLKQLYEIPAFYENLLTFFMKNDISSWDRRRIPMTERKKEIIEFTKSQETVFIQAFIQDFMVGVKRDEAFKRYQKWCKINGYRSGTQKDFKVNIKVHCNETKPRDGSTNRPTIFKLKPSSYANFDTTLPNEILEEPKEKPKKDENDVEIIEDFNYDSVNDFDSKIIPRDAQ